MVRKNDNASIMAALMRVGGSLMSDVVRSQVRIDLEGEIATLCRRQW